LNGHDQWFADFFQIRHRFGCYDEISEMDRGGCATATVRFVRVANSFNPAVNFVATKVRGEPVYEAVKPISPDTELLVYYLPERPEELFFVRMRASLYRQTMDSILEGIYCPERIRKNKKILLKGEHTSRELPIN
jgi:hypothetical protein